MAGIYLAAYDSDFGLYAAFTIYIITQEARDTYQPLTIKERL